MGLTVGIAILDTKGNLIDLTSKREAAKSEIIKYISKFGRPILIASDVNPLPKTIDKLASSLGCKVYYPRKSLSNTEKTKIIEDYTEEIKNSHQKDALAAGLRAFKNYHSLFLKIEEVLSKMNQQRLFEEVVEMMLKKKNENIIDVTKKILAKRR